ncbi:MAG: CBS and ACT domain-containing protein [Chloroflexia bacterium]
MLVKERMSTHPITIEPDTSVTEALSFMRQNRVRRLPVVDRHGNLLGIVSEKDLLYASPSPATSLSVYEIGYLLSKLKVKEIMTREVITVCPDCPIEEAARIMVDHKIGGLPVVEDGRLVGIITETDLFKVFLEMLGAREQGLRVSVSVRNEPGSLARLASAIAGLGGDILSLGTFYGEDRSHGRITLKVRGISEDQVREAVKQAEAELRDIRTS